MNEELQDKSAKWVEEVLKTMPEDPQINARIRNFLTGVDKAIESGLLDDNIPSDEAGVRWSLVDPHDEVGRRRFRHECDAIGAHWSELEAARNRDAATDEQTQTNPAAQAESVRRELESLKATLAEIIVHLDRERRNHIGTTRSIIEHVRNCLGGML